MRSSQPGVSERSRCIFTRINSPFLSDPTERKTMNRRKFVNLTFISRAGLSLAPDVIGQQKTIEPDLTALADGKVLSVFNCCLSSFKDGAKKGVRLSDDGVAYLTGVEFSNGAIEVEIRGKEVEQDRFIGVVLDWWGGRNFA